jgi:hypothetical protein
MHCRFLAVATLAILPLIPAQAQQSRWASTDDKTAKYIVEMERKWAEGVCADNGVVAHSSLRISRAHQRTVRDSPRPMS